MPIVILFSIVVGCVIGILYHKITENQIDPLSLILILLTTAFLYFGLLLNVRTSCFNICKKTPGITVSSDLLQLFCEQK